MKALMRSLLRSSIWIHLLVWSWNAFFLAVALFGLSFVAVDLVEQAWDGLAPWDLAATAALVTLVPAASTVFAVLVLRRDASRLLRFFYGVELPFFLVALGRLFFVRELTPAVALLLLVVGAATTTLFVSLRRPPAAPSSRRVAALHAAAAGLSLSVGLWLGALLSFYAAPLVYQIGATLLDGNAWTTFGRNLFLHGPGFLPIAALAAGFFGFAATIVIGLPPAFLALHALSARDRLRAASGPLRPVAAAAISTLAVAGTFLLVFAADRQPHEHALAVLATPPKSDAERRDRLAQSDTLRDGLVEGYLAPFRFVGSTNGASHVEEIYREVFRFLPREDATAVQRAWNHLARPFLYRGTTDNTERERAARLYAEFFDAPLQKTEAAAVRRALAATWSRDDAEAGLLDAGERRVLLARQEVTVTTRGGLAEVELHETYENQTPAAQEVLYHFSLPETAALTGVWLGESGVRREAFQYRVAPRGAAQKVYRGEVRRGRDPALLEQVGPSQYRLRVFPVPARPTGRARGPAPPLHLWVTYTTLPERGEWPMPRLAEQRNVYFTRSTLRRFLVDGAALPIALPESEWLPPRLPARIPPDMRARTIEIAGVGAVTARPLDARDAQLAPGGRIALVLDRSLSMSRHAEELAAALLVLRARLPDGARFDLFLTSSPARGEPPSRLDDQVDFGAAEILWYGGQTLRRTLAQFESLRDGRKYRAAIVLTDESALTGESDGDLAVADLALPPATTPLHVVHLGGVRPAAYEDAILEALQRSGGGAATNMEDTLARIALGEREPRMLDAGGGFVLLRGADAGAFSDEHLAPIATHALIAGAVRRFARRSENAALDRLHAIAVREHVVTPYSSMLVLVEQRQHEALDQAERDEDRFARASESGETTLPQTHGDFGGLTGTPEPEEWALLAIAAAALLYTFAERRRRVGALAPAA